MLGFRDSTTTFVAPGGRLGPHASALGVVGGGSFSVPRHWVDTLKVEVRAAAADTNFGTTPDTLAILQAIRSLPQDGFALYSLAGGSGSAAEASRVVVLSAPGFNRDSTIAIIRISFQQDRFSYGETLLLARKPGTEWRAWFSFLGWIT